MNTYSETFHTKSRLQLRTAIVSAIASMAMTAMLLFVPPEPLTAQFDGGPGRGDYKISGNFVKTDGAQEITGSSALLEATVFSGLPASDRGICYGTASTQSTLTQGISSHTPSTPTQTTSIPTTAETCIAADPSTSTFQIPITGLEQSTTYYARAYLLYQGKTLYGNEISFTTTELSSFALAENGITVTCADASPGQTGLIDGIEYEAVDRALLEQRRDEQADLTRVCTSSVTDMSALFEGSPGQLYPFNQPINHWDVSNVTDMSSMFSYSQFNQPIQQWCVSQFSTEPDGFSVGGSLEAKNKPLWGRCPLSSFATAQAYNEGWNMVSLPVTTDVRAYSDLFPTATVGTLYAFESTYTTADSLDTGEGYWIRLDEQAITPFVGGRVGPATLTLQSSWNLIGSVSEPAVLDDPQNVIIPGTFYGYDGIYSQASEVEPGRGYWVALASDGDLGLIPASDVATNSGANSVVSSTASSATNSTASSATNSTASSATNSTANSGDNLQGDTIDGGAAADAGTTSNSECTTGTESRYPSDRLQSELCSGGFHAIFFRVDGRALQPLYFGGELQNEYHPLQLSLPPLPPSGSVDARMHESRWLTETPDAEVMLQQNGQPLEISVAMFHQRFDGGTSSTIHGSGDAISETHGGYISEGNTEAPGTGQAYRLHFFDGMREIANAIVQPEEWVSIPAEATQIGVTQTTLSDEASEDAQNEFAQNDLPDAYALQPNYPNPFNPSTQIEYALPEAADVLLEVYNMLGQRVAILTNASQQPAGRYTVTFDAGNLTSGVYIYRLTAGTFTQTRKMLLLK